MKPRIARVLDRKAFGAAVRRARGDIPLRQIAPLIGVSFNTLARVERGTTTISADGFLAICRWFGFFNPMAFVKERGAHPAHLERGPQ